MRLAPDPQRPRVLLRFTISPTHQTVTGTEHIVFVPDKSITELVFRLTANSPDIVHRGTRITVHTATASPAGGAFGFSRAGAPSSTQGGLLRIPLTHAVAAGTPVTADLAFTVTLGGAYYERFGRSGSFAWFGSAQPLLAWQRGFGWHTEAMSPISASETATSEAMDTTLIVTAPAGETVIMTGDPRTPTGSGQSRVWQAHTSTARDVSVAVGPFTISDTAVGAVHLRVGAYTRAARNLLVPQFRRAIIDLGKRFGSYPFASLSVARVPGTQGGGIEYPAMIQMQSERVSDIVHETAHQWFYAMVGDSQSLHPWLDEAYAEYAERLVDANPEPSSYLSAAGTVDRSIESYGTDTYSYFFVTYAKGAAALEAARRAVGPSRWDARMRCYVAHNAWRIVTPNDVARSLQPYPKALAILRGAGALP